MSCNITYQLLQQSKHKAMDLILVSLISLAKKILYWDNKWGRHSNRFVLQLSPPYLTSWVKSIVCYNGSHGKHWLGMIAIQGKAYFFNSPQSMNWSCNLFSQLFELQKTLRLNRIWYAVSQIIFFFNFCCCLLKTYTKMNLWIYDACKLVRSKRQYKVTNEAGIQKISSQDNNYKEKLLKGRPSSRWLWRMWFLFSLLACFIHFPA